MEGRDREQRRALKGRREKREFFQREEREETWALEKRSAMDRVILR